MSRILSPTGQLLYCTILLLVSSQYGVSQGTPASAGRSRGWMGQSGGSAAGTPHQASGASQAVPGNPAPAAGDSSFATRLGTNVGLRAMPPVSVPLGVGNINHPGMQPLPTTAQPLPTGPVAPYPNINFPGGTPEMNNSPSLPPHWNSSWDGRWPGHFPGPHQKPYSGSPVIIYYGVPYYVPYPVYPQAAAPSPTATEASPLDRGPYGSDAAAAKPVTLLAFKDHTIIAVTDYWLEGDRIWYLTGLGLRTSVPLDRLDLPLTQQLNRERNVRFVLESRP